MVRRLQFLACKWSSRSFSLIGHLARRKVLTCVLMAILPMAIRVLGLRSAPIPEPIWDDEFSYVLGADTFASGRLTNPPHPMWVHFETMHVNWRPTYGTKYPPAQSLILAFGQRILGHPWFGVWISFGLMCAALCWMLQGWMPPVYALLGTLIGVAQLGIFRYWMNSYCGGAVAALGGCLVLGAAIRLARRTSASAAILGSLGLIVLANSRPYEGLVVSAAAGGALLWSRYRSPRGLSGLFAMRILAPCVIICGIAALWMGYYNYRVTGHVLVMPYAVNDRMYAPNTMFYLLPELPTPQYRHEVLRKLWMVWFRGRYLEVRHNPLAALPGFLREARFFWSVPLGFALVAALLVSRSRKVWLAVAILSTLMVGLLLLLDVAPHYFAPGILLLLVPAMYSVRWLRIVGRRFGPALVMLFLLSMALKAFRPDSYHDPYDSPPRQSVVRALTNRGGRHLVFVRYAPDHEIVLIDYVYNRANIDASAIVWARDMGDTANCELVGYYPDRQSWVWEADSSPMTLLPYDPAHAGAARPVTSR
jgi:hypothetical protein